MDIKYFIEDFAALFEENDASKFEAKTKFRNVDGWSSLVAISIIALIDEKFKVQITGNDIRKSETIEDLYNIIKSRV